MIKTQETKIRKLRDENGSLAHSEKFAREQYAQMKTVGDKLASMSADMAMSAQMQLKTAMEVIENLKKERAELASKADELEAKMKQSVETQSGCYSELVAARFEVGELQKHIALQQAK